MRRLIIVLRLLPVVAGASVIAILGLWLVRQWVTPSDLHDSNDSVGNYLQAIGTIYAVLLAFVVQSVWAQFNEARVLVDREANEVTDLHRLTDGLPDQARVALQTALRKYVEEVIAHEWPAMAKRDEDTLERIGKELDAVWDGLHELEPTSECEKSLHGEALSRFNDLSDARTNRLSAARTRMPFGLSLLLYVGAVVMVASMYLLEVQSFAIHAIITGALAAAVSHVLYLVIDLDDAFSGLWQVSTDPFRRARRQFGES
ncbi:MAG TPA: DUF4239 domain-containing protein [Kofleriaceae bacterium]|nr:DUF4239 domain-containing protein [Kofleriaceae bacterium]